jgi:hypothetical protein
MRKVKEVLRLRFELGFGQRQIARSCGMGLSTVHEYLERAVAAGVGWPLPEGLGEEALEAKLFGLVHHCVILELNIPSYRMEQAKKNRDAGLESAEAK